MKRALSLLLAGILSLSLLAGCSSAEQLSAKPISLTAQELSAHGPTTQNAYDALSAFGLELLQTTEQTGESALLSPLSVTLAPVSYTHLYTYLKEILQLLLHCFSLFF